VDFVVKYGLTTEYAKEIYAEKDKEKLENFISLTFVDFVVKYGLTTEYAKEIYAEKHKEKLENFISLTFVAFVKKLSGLCGKKRLNHRVRKGNIRRETQRKIRKFHFFNLCGLCEKT
jgi:hypothetical protein